ncbi:MAG TPA: 2Fe-2S iron-sulfur cluster binding domain-containing protein [Firmicutes bacterium]|nr:2Fe-2S iron-sulfur cluster binding domain-containing protein [Bacillota bacterium]
MELVNLTIDGQKLQVPKGFTVLEAARLAGIDIPTLCHHPDQEEKGVCRVCVVEVEGSRTLQASCAYPVAEGMVVRTNTPLVRQTRRTIVELMLARHPADCLSCVRNLHCELQALADRLGIREARFGREEKDLPLDESNPAIVRDPNKCILCRRCVDACHQVQGVGILYPVNRGADAIVAPAFEKSLAELPCTYCGQCINACPVGAIYEVDHTERVWKALGDPAKHVVVQTAPATRVSLGEEMGFGVGSIVTGKMVAALRRLGFDRVFDTDFTADLTIIEEGHELIHRLTHGGVLPMLTSCSPGWIKFLEHYYPEFIPNVSTCKSPQQMFGAVAKTYYADKMGLRPEDIYVVSIMPCTAKKFEAQRPEMDDSGVQDVDAVLTVRELGRMIREAGIDVMALPEEDYDDPLGISTGAAAIFGATGGVMEAALRTAYEVVTGKTLPALDFEGVRGLQGIKEATVDMDGTQVKVAVAHSLGNARRLLDAVKAGQVQYHFIEIMCCPGGCIGGGGQPVGTTNEARQRRIDAIYQVDRDLPLRKSHENPAIKTLYDEFLGQPLGEKSHHLLHTHYQTRPRYRSSV